MPTERSVPAQRALRLACGTALCTAASYGLGLPLSFLSPVLAVLLLASMPRPLPVKMALVLTLVAAFTTSLGLLLVPLLRYYPVCGVLLIAIGLFLVFTYGLRGGNVLIMTFLVIGMTMISAAGFASFELAMAVIGALVKGLLLAVVIVGLSHVLFPEPANSPAPPPAPALPAEDVPRVAMRATLIVLPTFLLVLIDPASYLPIILKAVSLGQQSTTTRTHHAGRELLGSTLLGGLLAVLFWCALSLFVHLWMFFLWMLLFGLFVARKLYRLHPTQLTPGFWLNTLITMIILLGQSVEDSAAGKDVYTAFAVRMGLFILVTLYSGVMMHLLVAHRESRQGVT
ncbi:MULTISPECIES: DUF2955 domain-containing protein [unclassified Pseudomonas]|uniref:DUF2955 domain-containing protein n=1 Tax=unclassified Pseudomonas TaxID=196821 RepID=UPI000C882383|nr:MULTISPECIES: DUF2955 domain-containing protein [unclassified Pseudomonas]PNA04019.1 hypothetical protein C1X28_17535 [Pseudomonas sp. FW305-BF15]PNB79030.1 hypothetical protein C1X30_20565 [Pseudomonas sp. FW305-BF6]